MKDPVDAVFVICSGENVRDNELSAAGNNDRIVTEVSVLEQDACILLVNANSILDRGALSSTVDECSTK